MKLYVGIDDTDSPNGMCTTYIATIIAERAFKYAELVEARLVRLNPNIKYKTRGNGSICLIFNVKEKFIDRIKEITIETVKEYAMLDDKNTNPGIAFYTGEITDDLKRFYEKVLKEVVDIKEAERIARKHGIEVYKFKKGLGIIGAVAAIGSYFDDYTYELIAYRKKENWGKPRKIDEESVYKMDSLTFPLTFNNVDRENNVVLIAPHTPCPVLYGIRGESIEVLKTASEMIKVYENIDRVMIFKTNQGTDAHIREAKIKDVKPYMSVAVLGVVEENPRTIEGGHVIFKIRDETGSIYCAAYEPTKNFRKIVKKLFVGDKVKVYGGVRNLDGKLTVNLEKIEILKIVDVYEYKNPRCPICGKRMKSAGKNKGYRCKKCKTKAYEKEKIKIKRDLKEGLYSVPPVAMRHLSKPIYRFSKGEFCDNDISN